MTVPFRITVFTALAAVAILLPVTTPTTTNPTGTVKDEIKCGNCPCGTSCYESPPPPPPPEPSPPPPPPTPSPPPPSPPKIPSPSPPSPGVNCPPPPPTGGGGGGGGDDGGGGGGGDDGEGEQPPAPDYVYPPGPPKDLYPVVETISAARRSFTVAPPLLVVLSGLMIILALW